MSIYTYYFFFCSFYERGETLGGNELSARQRALTYVSRSGYRHTYWVATLLRNICSSFLLSTVPSNFCLYLLIWFSFTFTTDNISIVFGSIYLQLVIKSVSPGVQPLCLGLYLVSNNKLKLLLRERFENFLQVLSATALFRWDSDNFFFPPTECFKIL